MLYALGSNGNGQLGIGSYEDVSKPQQCIIQYDEGDSPGTPVRISAGGNHTLLLFDSGRLFSTGSNQNGQAGISSKPSRAVDSPDPNATFTEIKFPYNFGRIKYCSATWEASVIVTYDNEVYTWGSGPNGELGTELNNSTEPVKLPRIPPQDEIIIDLASGVRHTVVVLSTGDVYGWGNGRKGQLGEPAEVIRAPRKISGVKCIRRATCGMEFTYLAGDPGEGRHLILGSNKWGVRTKSPNYVRDWKNIGSNWGGIVTLNSSGGLVAWGRNDHGQLDSSGITSSDVLQQIAVGSEHTLALTLSGQLLARGWGEHGNCGAKVDENKNVKDNWKMIPIKQNNNSETIIGIAAGCATSFMWTACRSLDQRYIYCFDVSPTENCSSIPWTNMA